MATYQINAPDGSQYHVEGPQGADPSAVIQQVMEQHQSAAPEEKPSALGANIVEPALHIGSQMLSLPVAAGASLYQLATSPPGLKASNAAQAAQSVQQAMTYQPRTREGSAISGGIDTALGLIPKGVDWLTGNIAENPTVKGALGPTGSEYLQATANLAGNAIPAILGGKGVGMLTRAGRGAEIADAGAAGTTASDATATAAARAQNYVASRTSLDWNSLSAGLKAQLAQVAQDATNLGKLDPAALERQARLESLPVPAQGTLGQLTRDPVQLRNEGNVSATQAGKPIRDVYVQQNKALVGSLAKLRGEVSGSGENAATAETPEQVGTSMQDAARAKLAYQKSIVKALYDQAEATGETQGTVSIAPIQELLKNIPDTTHLGYAQSWLDRVLKPAEETPAATTPASSAPKFGAGPSPERDSILQYLARHSEGLNSSEAAAQGIDPADMTLHAAHVGIQRAFRKNGMSFDQAAETLHEAGYPVQDAYGKYDPNVLLDRISDELHGHPTYSVRNPSLGYDVQGETLQALAGKARAYDPDAAERILESQASDHEVASRLQDVINAGRSQNAAAGGAPKELSLKALEDLRQAAVAKAMNGGADGYYAGKLINAIDQATAGAGGAAYQAARAARKAQALEFEDQAGVSRLVDNASRTDPAVAAERTWRTTVLNGSIKNLRDVKRSLLTGGSPRTLAQGRKAWNDLRAQTLQYITDEATKGVSRFEDGTPNVTPAAMERAIKTIGPEKLEEIFGGGTTAKIRQIMEATRDLKTEPPPGFKGSPTFANIIAFLEKSIGKVPFVGDTVTGAVRGIRQLRQMGQAGRDVNRAMQTPVGNLAAAAQKQARNQRLTAPFRQAPAVLLPGTMNSGGQQPPGLFGRWNTGAGLMGGGLVSAPQPGGLMGNP